MGDKKIVIDKTLDANQTAAFLRLLADELTGNSNLEPNEFGCQLHGFNKLKISLIKQEGGRLSVRLKIKDGLQGSPALSSEFTDVAAQDYRPFKQLLKATFAELNSCGKQGVLPSPELLSRFMAESQQLVSFPGFGDPYYDDYHAACRAMAQAVRDGSPPAFQEKLAAINTIKKACHRRFR